MSKLRLGPIVDEKPVRVSIDLPAQLYRDLVAYGAVLARESGQAKLEPTKLISPMLERFMRGDKAFTKMRRSEQMRGG